MTGEGSELLPLALVPDVQPLATMSNTESTTAEMAFSADWRMRLPLPTRLGE
ncbi:MAG: hypothetical protein ACO3I3_10335 [Vulcanococcus sp.]